MGLEELAPGNTKRAKATAVSAFMRFLKSEGVTEDCSSDYQDAALLCLLWHLFGRASDLALLRKPNVSIDAGNVLFVRFIRMKTSEEQGLSLFPGTDFTTCPMLAIALALMMQTAPSPDVIDNLPELPGQAAISLSPDVPLLEILNHPTDTTGLDAPSTAGAETTPTIYSHVNRLLNRIAAAAGVKVALTSHSFRRGGAQHANGSGELTARWIFDRGAWNMSTTNKGLNYQQGISQVLDVLTSSVLRHYLLLKDLNAEAPAVKRIEGCVADTGCSLSELLAWSSHLASPQLTCEDTKSQSTHQQQQIVVSKQLMEPSAEQKIIDHQAAVINHFIQHVKRQDARMDALEAKLNNNPSHATRKRHKPDTDTSDISNVKKKQRRSAVTHLRATWYAWYAHEPRMWRAPISKQQKSDAKQLVAYMKLFLEDGFVLDPTAPNYRDQVLSLGARAEESVLAFLGEHNISSRGSGAVLKHLRILHRAGTLNTNIGRHEQLLQTPAIQDPAPGYTQNILEQIRA
uniref:Uncharacterized protein n=1 Tax=Phytophthora ramorum TaxID=164328 RepID=H3GG50_PHYRM